MKKLFLSALLAALAFGSAQAVTTGWAFLTDGPSSAGRLNGQPSGQTIWANTSGTLAASVVLSGENVGSGVILATGKNGFEAGNQIVLSIDNGQWKVTVCGNEVASYTGSRDVSLGEYAIGFTMTRGTADSGKCTVTVSINGQVLASVENATGFGGPIGSYAWGQTITQSNAYTGEATYEVFLLDGNDNVALDPSTIAADVKALPEPTALALLALGVAGLALRRRAA